MSALSDQERVRRATFWVLGGGVLLAWLGALMGLSERAQAGRVPLVVVVPLLAALVAFSVLYVRVVLAAIAGYVARREVVVSGLLTLALLGVFGRESWGWAIVGGVWASAAVLGVSRARAALIGAGTVVVCVLLATPKANHPALYIPSGLSYTFMIVAAIWANRFQLWLWHVVKAAEEGREARARLAVTEERLRFARDLHDLVGHRLSAIAVKSEVATKLAVADGARAAEEMAEVRRLARESLREIRTAVRGYRTIDLDAELRSVRAVLEAGGVKCALELPETRLPDEVSTVLAWAVREGTTNVLRHSSASRCDIKVAVKEGSAVLTMRNDGVQEGSAAEGPGSGLAGLAERVASLGGVLRAGPGERGEFLLTVTVPVEGGRA